MRSWWRRPALRADCHGLRQRSAIVATRPDDLIYAVDELPPWPRLLLLGAQQALLMSVYLVLVVLVFRRANADQATAMTAVSLGLVALAVAVTLQALRLGPIGSGYLAPPVFSAIYLAPALAAADAGGLPAVFGMTIFAALLELGLAPLVARLRHLFPATVSGLIVMVVGLELGIIGMRDVLALDQRHQPDFAVHVATACLTLGTMIGLRHGFQNALMRLAMMKMQGDMDPAQHGRGAPV